MTFSEALGAALQKQGVSAAQVKQFKKEANKGSFDAGAYSLLCCSKYTKHLIYPPSCETCTREIRTAHASAFLMGCCPNTRRLLPLPRRDCRRNRSRCCFCSARRSPLDGDQEPNSRPGMCIDFSASACAHQSYLHDLGQGVRRGCPCDPSRSLACIQLESVL
jgi:hypothetical protein